MLSKLSWSTVMTWNKPIFEKSNEGVFSHEFRKYSLFDWNLLIVPEFVSSFDKHQKKKKSNQSARGTPQR